MRFGAGVFGHLVRNRHRYDVVHTCSFPYFSVLSTWAALLGTPTQMGVDWFEVWSDSYWREYLGGLNGRVGSVVQRACAMVTPLAFVASERHGRRLAEIGLKGEVRAIGGLYAGVEAARSPELGRTGAPLILFAGRLISGEAGRSRTGGPHGGPADIIPLPVRSSLGTGRLARTSSGRSPGIGRPKRWRCSVL